VKACHSEGVSYDFPTRRRGHFLVESAESRVLSCGMARSITNQKLRKWSWLFVNCALVVVAFFAGFFRLGQNESQIQSLSWPVLLLTAAASPLLLLGVLNWFTGRPAHSPSLFGSIFNHSGFFQFIFIGSLANVAFGLGELASGLPNVHISPSTAKYSVVGSITLAECFFLTKLGIGVRKTQEEDRAPM
jgi:hypothetical protein